MLPLIETVAPEVTRFPSPSLPSHETRFPPFTQSPEKFRVEAFGNVSKIEYLPSTFEVNEIFDPSGPIKPTPPPSVPTIVKLEITGKATAFFNQVVVEAPPL